MRDRKTGDALAGAHIRQSSLSLISVRCGGIDDAFFFSVGFMRRITKLLYFGIKPVFVFDGDAPALKKRTIVSHFESRNRIPEFHADSRIERE